ncbi:hypothetical protein BTO32_06035 [Marinobacter lutaoensis]|uniref:Uncharacterized protein n=1 Tax=Marinobacter lutaoensis TaxID=135739 RepID=A0A1V2DV88_9GAMM|nr:hypothetical protein [Marinobacter lutaoensis]ONF44538.1 hypothetical protein BTO32_06035 [Marinobacter lutaoensis]
MLSVLVTKLVATALVVIGVSLAVGRLGPRLGGILAGTPIILGPGYYFMLQERSVPFLQEAALATLHALVATLAFSACFIVATGRFGLAASLVLASACWLPLALGLSLLPGGVTVALLVYAAALLAAETIRWALRLRQSVVVARAGWFDLVLRGLLAGVVVAVATTVAAGSGPMLSGILVGFPVGLFTIGWTLHQRYGADVARATVGIAQKGMLSLVAFAGVLAWTVDWLPPMATFLASLLASVLVSLLLFLVSQWRYRSAGGHLPIHPREPEP